MFQAIVYTVVTWTYVLATFSAAGLTLFKWAFLDNPDDPHRMLLNTLVGICATVSGGALAMKKWVGEPWIKDSARWILNELRAEAFALTDNRVHFYRAVAFKKVRVAWRGWWAWSQCHPMPPGHIETNLLLRAWSRVFPLGYFGNRARLPWSGWLVPVVASHDEDRPSRAMFVAPRDFTWSEGLVGMAWMNRLSRGSALKIPSLPLLDGHHAPHDVTTYAQNCRLSPEWISHRLGRQAAGDEVLFAGSLLATVIESDRNRPWGVLELHSPLANAITIDPDDPACRLATLALGELLAKR